MLPPPNTLLSDYKGKRLLFGFDFDGTLVELRERPGEVFLGQAERANLEKIALRHNVLICSGRSVADLLVHIPSVPGIDFIGNHGFEWFFEKQRGGPRIEWDLTPDEWREFRRHAIPSINNVIARNGGELEDKRASISIHFRRSGSEWWSSRNAEQWLSVLTSDSEQSQARRRARIVPGKMCWNILPIGMSKGDAVARYLGEFSFDQAVYFGDEVTDESVFEKKELPLIGVKVGEGPTAAPYRLPEVKAVRRWLAQLSIVDSGLI